MWLPHKGKIMTKIVWIFCLIIFVVACSKEDGGVTGSEPKEMLSDVQQQLDQTATAAEKRLEEGLKKIDGDR